MQEIELSKSYTFDAAHFLPKVPDGHKCKRIHGHTFRFKLYLRGKKDPELGWLVDFGDVTKKVKPILDNYLDHNFLNAIPGLSNPTSENIAIWLWDKLVDDIPLLYKITVHETCTSACTYIGKEI